ncbi:MAG TPA: right-handed parallel beta-helix repeat-containing protein [bacterium]|nr:right-handed parallel beta-helix repeat-containing protein [bacterium]
MKFKQLLFLSLLALAALTGFAAPGAGDETSAKKPDPAAAAAPGHIYYVSSKGSDANDGASVKTPFASIAKLNGVLAAGDTARFKRGEIFFGTLRPKTSGTAAAPIRIGAYGTGARPIITGFRRITGWKAAGPGLYQATLDPAPTGRLEMIRFDGRLQPKGRLPKAGRGWKPGSDTDSWFEIRSHLANREITSADAVPDVAGGEIVQKKYQWIIDRGRIDTVLTNNVDGQTLRTIKITEYPTLYDNPYHAFDKNGFFVQNHVSCLTEPGDWCYDETTRRITMHFGAGPPDRHVVEAAALDNAVDLTNRAYVNLEDLALTGANGDLVRLDVPDNLTGKCHRVSINNCDLAFAGRNGVAVIEHRFTTYTSDAADGSITNCTISEINNNGISLGENPRWTITGNTLSRIALNEGLQQNSDGQGIGIFAAGADSLIQHNEISQVGYSGLYFVGSGIQIRNNHIHHFCLVKSDGGGIYTYGGETRKTHAKPRVIDRNVVHDGVGSIEGRHVSEAGNPYTPQCQGIYMDGNATDVIITGNTSFRNASAGLSLGSNSRITVYGNTLADNHTTQLQIDDQKSPPANLDIHDNILFAFEREQLCLSVGLARKPGNLTQAQYVAAIGTLADNLYLRPVREPENISTIGYPHCGDGGGHDPNRSHANYGVFNDYPGGGIIATTWNGSPFLSLDRWQKEWGQDAGTRKTFRSVAGIADLRLEYNPTDAAAVKKLPGVFEDARGAVYKNSLTLPPYSSAVLMRKP